MTDQGNLHVWCGQQQVGHLWRDEQDRLGFQYAASWLAEGGFPISHSLPLQTDAFAPNAGVAHRFFANLLPEGDARARIARGLKTADTDFNLLRAIGGECAGALSIMPTGEPPPAAPQTDPKPLTVEELSQLVARRGQFRAEPEGKPPRLSLAGAQDKCPVLFKNGVKGGAFHQPGPGAPSSHILKFDVPGYRNVPAYETFTTLLAKAVGLPVVDIQLRSTDDGLRYVLIGRYDRVRDARGNITRLHQEDFCQALGIGHHKKYQEDGGPSFADCYHLLRDVSGDTANDLLHLLRWQIFSVLAGNSDGHAKNLSLLYHANGEIRLAPFYDLVCTRAIEHISKSLAFWVGGEKNPDVLSARHWDEMARQCGLRPSFLQGQVKAVAADLLEQLKPTRQAFEELHGEYPALQRVEDVVTKQCRRAGRG